MNSKTARFSLICLLVLIFTGVLLLGLLPAASRAASLTVNTAVDESDGQCGGGGNPGGDSDCSLRDAIAYANGNAGADTIDFASNMTISVTLGGLTITDDDTTIDGDRNDDGAPDVALVYDGSTSYHGLELESSDNRIEGLTILDFPYNGIFVDGDGDLSNDNEIVNCYIGTDGTLDRGNGIIGIYVDSVAGGGSGADRTLIAGNLIAGNGSNGIRVTGAVGTQIVSNTVGTNLAGTTALPNDSSGISLNDAQTTTVESNLLSGNNSNGLYMNSVTNTVIASNTIGTNEAGTAALPNTGYGIYAEDSVTLTVEASLISGNRYYGIFLTNCSHGSVVGNKIGTDAAGTGGLGNGRSPYNRDGIALVDSTGITIGGSADSDRNIISHNGRAGVWLDDSDGNTVQNNYIGTDVTGTADLGNGGNPAFVDGTAGVYLKDGASDNVLQENRIRYNSIGLRLSGDPASGWLPPMGNDVLTNTITSNDKYGITCKATHSNTVPYATPGDGDNLFQGNVITGTGYCTEVWCLGDGDGVGVFNYGASPYMVDNTIEANKDVGVVNLVYFGDDSAAAPADDILSMPHIVDNSIQENEEGGVVSRDTAPVNKATLLADNAFSNNGGKPHISQRWFGAVEVVSDSVTIDSGVAVTITRAGGEPPSTCRNGDCFGSTFGPVGGGSDNGIWGTSVISYHDVEENGLSTWFEIVEYEVDWQGNWITYTPHLVQVGGAHLGARSFTFDGITTTAEMTGDVNLPTCVNTGILSDPSHTLCRYQLPQVEILQSDGDYDDDGIPDSEEGNDDTDGDGIPDWQDEDSDNDGIPDSEEGNVDTDGDGIPDFQDEDSDDDGVPDDDEYDWCGSPPCDTDGDGIPDYQDDDDDDDGVPTIDEDIDDDGDPTNDDSDGDGIPDYLDEDDDGDGVPTIDEDVDGDGDPTNDDSDGDGIPDYLDTDSDGDGIDDMDEAGCEDTNGDGQADTCPPEAPDEDEDGIPDYLESNTNDADGDGIPDYQDTDSDGDGIPDATEGLDDTDDDGIPDYLESNIRDTDGDGTPDYQDTDADGDDIPDGEEGPYTDTDGDGVPDYLENNLAPDNDSPPDYDTDPDDDDTPPNEDGDADGDGIPDATEFYPQCSPGADLRDTDFDGIPNCADWDADGDGIPNFLDLDSDNDGVSDEDEGTDDDNDNGIPDYLDPPYAIYMPLIFRDF